MAKSVDELTVTWTDDDGTVTVRQMDKKILTKGAWATVMYLYQDLNRKSGDYGPAKIRIQRYQKRNGFYIPQSKFNISSVKQAGKIVQVLNDWIADLGDEEA